MNRYLTFSLAISMTLSYTGHSSARGKQAARGEVGRGKLYYGRTRTSKNLAGPGLISVVGQASGRSDSGRRGAFTVPRGHRILSGTPSTPRSCGLSSNGGEVRLQEYRQALDEVRSLKTMTGCVDLDRGDIGITPEAGIEILQRRVYEIQSELDDLEDLARHNDIPPRHATGPSDARSSASETMPRLVP